jgi:hypothetical protein
MMRSRGMLSLATDGILHEEEAEGWAGLVVVRIDRLELAMPGFV